ncbi:MAG: hypothetical protein JST00_07805 [Deltaproteobacteria bacterium]|nr:hypothetical protein [Deltaproteobacteria bacterium]
MNHAYRTLLPIVPIAAALALSISSSSRRAVAEPAAADTAAFNERCANRLHIAMVGESAPADALSSAQPQSTFDTLAKDPRFVERFSRFINSQFNNAPGATPSEDASYYLTKYVLTNGKPWSDMFVGKYRVAAANPQQPMAEPTVTDDPNGLGYFRSPAWMIRYAGNEPAGIRIVTAYRMMQNTIGLALSATTNAPDADVSASGRKAAQCAGCHYTPWFALDHVAEVLGTRQGTGMNTTFQPPTGGAKEILGGTKVSNDKELVEALVGNHAFDVNACRLAYKYLYGRPEASCEGPSFDACVSAFQKDKQIVSALAVVAKDPKFCD